ncbi:MAG TPA: GNAT family N-acetyltransferase [Bauldia sp.]|jgi:CelD/BcsL family acetyltransferase involved in cellulose biosynthesis
MPLPHALLLDGSPAPASAPTRRENAQPLPPPALGAEGKDVAGAGRWPAIELRVTSDLGAIEETWRAFEGEAEGTVFQTFDWLSKWQRHIGALAGAVPAIVTGRDADGSMLFLLPLAVERQRLARRLTWLGEDLCDYNGPLLRRGFGERFGAAGFPALWREILGLLRSDLRFGFDYVDLPKMLEMVGSQPNPFISLETHSNPSGAYVANLGTDWETFYAAHRSGPTRKKERKQLKQLAEHGAVRFVEVQEPTAVVISMEALIGQKSAAFRRMGVSDNFARPGFRSFYLDLAADPRCLDIVNVSRLDVGDTIAAASVGLRFGDNYYLVLSSYADGDLARFGPGRAHLNELLRHAIDRKVRRFDFTIGDEPYKRDWADVVLRPLDHLQPVTIRGRVMVSGMTAFRTLKRFIKQTPALWRTFTKVRAWKASLLNPAKGPVARAAEAEAD